MNIVRFETEEVLLSLRDLLPPLCLQAILVLHDSTEAALTLIIGPLYLEPKACGEWRLAESEINSICCASLAAPNAKVRVAQ